MSAREPGPPLDVSRWSRLRAGVVRQWRWMQVNQSGDPRSGDQYADKKGMMRPKAIEIRQNAISQSLKHESAALGWQWTDVVLVASTAALAAAGGAAGIAKATISTTGNTSSIAAS